MTVTFDSKDVVIIHQGFKMNLYDIISKLEGIDGSAMLEDSKTAAIEEIDSKMDDKFSDIDSSITENKDKLVEIEERIKEVEKILDGI